MGKKLIKLTEQDLTNIVKKVIQEQEENGVGPYPVPEKEIPVQDVTEKTPSSIIRTRDVARMKIKSALAQMKELGDMGINTEDAINIIEKGLDKFNSLFNDYKMMNKKEEKPNDTFYR